jgi:predicted O-methyltransferase YrrM
LSGLVGEENTNKGGVMEFNEKVNHDPRIENLLLPFRDGLMILRKKG